MAQERGLKLYLEDGYEIDEDEILISTIAKDKVLVMGTERPRQQEQKRNKGGTYLWNKLSFKMSMRLTNLVAIKFRTQSHFYEFKH